MTAEEKASVFNLIRAASAWGSGYVSKELEESPVFEDDVMPPSVQEKPLEAAQSVVEQVQTYSSQSTAPLPEEKTDTKQGESGVTLESITQKISSCKNCILCQKRTNTVPGEGVSHPYVMVIGEGPGEDEDRTGRPFVGKAGQLLDKMLASISLSRDSNCFIANIVKCRPPLNRTPMKDEADACRGYLQAQIHVLKPRYILAMGRTAVQSLLETDKGINSLRGKFLDYKGIPLLATYHPSALLRDEALKRPAWEDLKTFRARISQEIPDYATEFFKNQNKA